MIGRVALGRQADQALAPGADRGQIAGGLLQLAQDRLCADEEPATGLGQQHLADRPDEAALAEAALQVS